MTGRSKNLRIFSVCTFSSGTSTLHTFSAQRYLLGLRVDRLYPRPASPGNLNYFRPQHAHSLLSFVVPNLGRHALYTCSLPAFPQVTCSCGSVLANLPSLRLTEPRNAAHRLFPQLNSAILSLAVFANAPLSRRGPSPHSTPLEHIGTFLLERRSLFSQQQNSWFSGGALLAACSSLKLPDGKC